MAKLPQKCPRVPDTHFSEPTPFIFPWSPPSSLTQLLPVMILVWYQSTDWTLWSLFFLFYHRFSSHPFQRLPTCPLSSYKGLCSWGPPRRESALLKGSRTVTRREQESAHKVARETRQFSKAASSSMFIKSWRQLTSVSSSLRAVSQAHQSRVAWMTDTVDGQTFRCSGERGLASQPCEELGSHKCHLRCHPVCATERGHFHIKIWLLQSRGEKWHILLHYLNIPAEHQIKNIH